MAPELPAAARARHAIRRRLQQAGHESGQSLVLIVIAMAALLGAAAMAIDVSSWYQKHHQEQVAADAAALAAANCLAGQSPSNTAANMCTSPMDTTHASSIATGVATTNSASTSTIQYGTQVLASGPTVTDVTVTTAAPTSSFFSGITGLSPTARATAVATVKYKGQPCPSSGSGCLMFYAANSDCSAAAISIQVGNSVNVDGGILTNSYVSDAANGGNFTGHISYGAGATCANNETLKGTSNSIYAPTQQPTNYGTTGTPNWPIDYSTLFPACSGTGSAPTNCSSSGAPTYCTYTSTSTKTTLTTSGDGVYCAIGSGTASNPATWNGSVGAGNSSGAKITMIGGSVSINGVTDSAYSNGLLAYATGTGSQAFDGTGGDTQWTGDVFAPNGGATISGGNVTFTGFVEAQNITYKGGDSTGSGPLYSGGNTLSGRDYLTG